MNANFHTSDNRHFSLPVQQNNNMVRTEINKDSHPHPLILMFIIITVLVLIYFIYIYKIKTCFNTTWYSATEEIKICHNKWADTLLITIIEKNKQTNCMGYIVGNAIYMKVIKEGENYEFMGVFKDNKIYWLNGDIWQKEKIGVLVN